MCTRKYLTWPALAVAVSDGAGRARALGPVVLRLAGRQGRAIGLGVTGVDALPVPARLVVQALGVVVTALDYRGF